MGTEGGGAQSDVTSPRACCHVYILNFPTQRYPDGSQLPSIICTIPSGSLSCPSLLFSVASVLTVSLSLFLLSSPVLPANTSNGVVYAEANPNGSEAMGNASGRVCLGRSVWPHFTNHKQPQMWARVFQGRHAWSILYLLTLLYVIRRSQKSEFLI